MNKKDKREISVSKDTICYLNTVQPSPNHRNDVSSIFNLYPVLLCTCGFILYTHNKRKSGFCTFAKDYFVIAIYIQSTP
jgi:hypothetical protein